MRILLSCAGFSEVDAVPREVGVSLEANVASIFTGAMPPLVVISNFFAALCDKSISRPLT